MIPLRAALGTAVLFAVLCMGWVANQDVLPVGISWNRSPSLPVGLYWHTQAKPPFSREDEVCFAYHAPEWARERKYLPEGSLVCKRLLGLPGDLLVQEGGHLEVCGSSGCRDVGLIADHDSRGRPVKPAALPNRIPDGSVYLGVPEVAASFDSRYLGLVRIKALVRTLHPLWIRGWASPNLSPREMKKGEHQSPVIVEPNGRLRAMK